MKRIISYIMLMVMVLSLVACGGSAPKPTASNAADKAAASSVDAADNSNRDNAANSAGAVPEKSTQAASKTENTRSKEDAFPLTIADQAGRSVTIESMPETIVSGYYISSSILIALGLGEKMVGIEAKADKRSIYSLAAPGLLELPNVGSAKEFDLEGCAALKPDLTILPIKLKDAASSLEELGLKVILINPENTEDLYEAIAIIASSTGAGQRGEALISAMEKMYADLSALTGDLETPTVYMASNSAFLSTSGSKMYQSAMIENAGGTNAAGDIEDSYWSAISYEQLLNWNPEYIVIAAEADYSVDDVLSDINISECIAVKNGNVYKMPDDIEAWDSPVPGGALGSIWLASIIHEDKVSKEYYEKSVSDFYGSFYGFER